MKFSEYQKLALITSNKDHSSFEMLEHSGYGLVTEIGEIVDAFKRHRFYGSELDLVNILEEVGDVLWYLAIGSKGWEANGAYDLGEMESVGDKELEVLAPTFKDLPFLERVRYAEKVLSMIAYSASVVFKYTNIVSEEECLKSSLDVCFAEIIAGLMVVCAVLDIDYHKAKPTNINKLERRYPDGFEAYRALNRDLDMERISLEEDFKAEPEVDTKAESEEVKSE